MKQSTWLFRFLFFVSALLVGSLYYHQNSQAFISTSGILMGVGIFALAFSLELLIRKISMRVFNIFLFGLLYGSLIGYVLLSFFKVINDACKNAIPESTFQNIQVFALLTSAYLGIWVASYAFQNWQKLLPFLRTPAPQMVKKHPIYIDLSALDDTRLIELAKTGLVDGKLVLADFVLQEIHKYAESIDENLRLKAKRCQDTIKRLESIPRLALEMKSCQNVQNEEYTQKMHKEVKANAAYLLVQEALLVREEQESSIICLDTLATLLKPAAQRGEALFIKIQRLGKEPNQGIGYLKDGTMVVVNGGGEYLNSTIRTQVLSQKYSSSGKIIFCNTAIQDESSIIRHDVQVQAADSGIINQMSIR